METVCLKCGDIGFPETLVFCDDCHAYALHRYCLDGPVIFWEEVTWFCEDCEAKLSEPSPLDQSIPVSSGTRGSISLANDAIKARRELKNCMGRVKKSNQQAHKIIVEENQKKIKVSSQQQQKIIEDEKQKKRKVSSQQQQKMIEKEKQTKSKVNPGLVDKTKALLSDCHRLHQLEHTQCSNCSEEGSKFKNECGPFPRGEANSNVGSESVQISLVATNDDLTCVELDRHVYAQPIANPIWRGCFNFSDGTTGTVTGLLAHMSSLACSKVLDETQLLPKVLYADWLLRSAVWPKSFKICGPTDQSIALYFFPENEREEKAFDKLVDDIIQLELAISVVAENAQLLIFPSTVLPLKHRRFQAKYYLWGVYMAKKTSRKENYAVCGKDAGVDKRLAGHNHSLSNTLSNSGSYDSNA